MCKLGDIWQLGNHRLMVGDSTDPRYVNALMGGEQADLLVTDPPYNVDYEGSNGKKIQNDSMDESQFRQFLLQAYCCALDACRTGAAAYIFHADTEGEAFRAMFREAGWELHGCLIWVKNSLVLGRADYQYQHEPCLYGWKPGAGHYFINDRTNTTVIDDAKPEDLKKMKKEDLLAWATRVQQFLQKEQTTVLRYDKPAANKEHPTMKPVPLVGHLIKNSSKPGQIVLVVRRQRQHTDRLRADESPLLHDGIRPAVRRRHHRPLAAIHRARGGQTELMRQVTCRADKAPQSACMEEV